MPQTKATKKFERKHLGDVLKRRKEVKKIKQREQKKNKNRERGQENGDAPDTGDEKSSKKSADNVLSSMSVDDFFAGGFEIPQDPKASKSRKRKRTTPKEAVEESEQEFEDAIPLDTPEKDSDDSSEGEEVDFKKQLAALAEKQPEFQKYLQENDRELLDFGSDNMALDALSDSDAEEIPKMKKKKKTKGDEEEPSEEETDVREVKIAQVDKWKKAITEQNSLRSARELLFAFRAATHINDEDVEKYRYSISDPEVYHALVTTALNAIPSLIQHHVPIKEKAGGRIQIPTDSPKFKTISPLIKIFIGSVQHLLENLSDAATMKVTMAAILEVAPYVLSHKKLIKGLTKTIVEIWSDSTNSELSRFAAFGILRKLVVIGDAGIREAVLRATYQGLVKGSRNTSVHTIQGVNLMKNSAAGLWGIDATVGYTTGFNFIRQLAIHLRTSISNKSKESYKTVYNWQYVHSLDFWSRVLSMFCDNIREAESGKQSPLRPLIYPVVQVILGALRLIPTSQYFPLRFQLIRSLLRISLATGIYIPIAPSLYEVLTSAEMRKPPKASTLKSLDFSTNIRAPASYLKTRVYQDGVGEQVVELFSEFFVQWAKNIAFPEFALPVVVMLKRWLKDMNSKTSGNKNSKVNSAVALLVQKLEANSRWIEERRAKVEFAPNNRAGVEGFLKDVEWEKSPLGAYVVTQRKTREDREKLIEKARRDEEKDKKKEKKEREQAKKVAEEEADGFEAEEDEEDDDDEEMESAGDEDESN